MTEYELAIHGSGLLPGLLAVHLLDQNPDARLLLLTADPAMCGTQLEPVVQSRLSTASAALVDPFAVMRWQAHYTVSDGETRLHDGAVLLIDPVQVWIELQERLPGRAIVANCGAVAFAEGLVDWAGGSARVDRMVDLQPLLGGDSESEIVGSGTLRELDYPVLADFDTAGDRWGALQYLPLGDERVVIRKLPRTNDLLGMEGRFERTLNGLTGI